MTDQELKDLVASLAIKSASLDEQLSKNIAEMKAASAASDARFDKLAAKYGGLSDNLGSAAEEFFINSLEDHPVVGGIRFDAVHPRVYGGKMGKQTEYDIVLVNGASAAIIEVKHKVHPSSLDQLEAQLAKYKEHFPEHKDFALYGGIAGMSIPDEVVAQAKARGLFVLKCKGKVMEADSAGMRAF